MDLRCFVLDSAVWPMFLCGVFEIPDKGVRGWRDGEWVVLGAVCLVLEIPDKGHSGMTGWGGRLKDTPLEPAGGGNGKLAEWGLC